MLYPKTIINVLSQVCIFINVGVFFILHTNFLFSLNNYFLCIIIMKCMIVYNVGKFVFFILGAALTYNYWYVFLLQTTISKAYTNVNFVHQTFFDVLTDGILSINLCPLTCCPSNVCFGFIVHTLHGSNISSKQQNVFMFYSGTVS